MISSMADSVFDEKKMIAGKTKAEHTTAETSRHCESMLFQTPNDNILTQEGMEWL